MLNELLPAKSQRLVCFSQRSRQSDLNLGPATEPALDRTGHLINRQCDRIHLFATPRHQLQILINSDRGLRCTSSAMANLAAAMTNYIREASNHTVSGQLGITETYVRVSRLWITLPGMLVIAGALFLIAGILETRRRGVDAWKRWTGIAVDGLAG